MPQRGILWVAKTRLGSLRAIGTFCAKTTHQHKAYLRHAALHSGLLSTHKMFLRNIGALLFRATKSPVSAETGLTHYLKK